MAEVLGARFSTRFVEAGFAGDRSALLRFDCLAKGYSVKVSATFRTAPVLTTVSYHCAGAGEN